jgi:hypothetical protein
VTALIDAFQVFDLVYVMASGGPLRGTDVAGFYLYRYGFRFYELGVRLGDRLHDVRPDLHHHGRAVPAVARGPRCLALGITLGQTILSGMAGYAFARLRFPGRDALFFLVLGTMMIPFPVTLIPSFLIVADLGWLETYQALIVPRLVSAFAIFLFRQFFLSIPLEL